MLNLDRSIGQIRLNVKGCQVSSCTLANIVDPKQTQLSEALGIGSTLLRCGCHGLLLSFYTVLLDVTADVNFLKKNLVSCTCIPTPP